MKKARPISSGGLLKIIKREAAKSGMKIRTFKISGSKSSRKRTCQDLANFLRKTRRYRKETRRSSIKFGP